MNLRNHEKLQIYSHMQGGEVLPDATLCNRYGMGQVFGRLRCKNTPICTWEHVFGRVRCKNTPLLHLEAGFRPAQVQKYPLFAPGARGVTICDTPLLQYWLCRNVCLYRTRCSISQCPLWRPRMPMLSLQGFKPIRLTYKSEQFCSVSARESRRINL